jgi:hypothetical protein
MKLDWHFNFWLMFIFSVLSLLSGVIFTPETVTVVVFLISCLFSDCDRLTSMPLYCYADAPENSRENPMGSSITFPSTIETAQNPSCRPFSQTLAVHLVRSFLDRAVTQGSYRVQYS